jgi:type II secretory pathway pseudopilin PulG
VVIGVIGILAALLLPTFGHAKSKAHQIQCVSNLRQFGIGLQGFVTDNHTYPKLSGGTNSDQPYGWMYQLEHGGFDVSKPKKGYWTEGVWKCPSARWNMANPPMTPTFCYSYNAYGASGHSPRNKFLGLSAQPISRAVGPESGVKTGGFC